jgi:pimeloyl-ACP methyl ester carboxylesterase
MMLAVIATLALVTQTAAPEHVSFPSEDGGVVHADLYGRGDRAVVLVHGGRFNKESWAKQALVFADAGLRVAAINLRGYGESRGPGQQDIFTAPLHLDVLAAVRYLRKHGAKTVSLVGGSLGGGASASAAIQSPSEIHRLVLLGSGIDGNPEQLRTPVLFILAKEDTSGDGPRLPGIRADYDKVQGPKEWIVLDGSAHAQFLFETDQAGRVMREILRFLTAPVVR